MSNYKKSAKTTGSTTGTLSFGGDPGSGNPDTGSKTGLAIKNPPPKGKKAKAKKQGAKP